MPPKILIQKEAESLPLVLIDLSDATPTEKAAVIALLGLRTRNSRFNKVPLGLLKSDGSALLTNQGERIFSKLQPPVAPETIETLGAAWLAEINPPANAPDSPV